MANASEIIEIIYISAATAPFSVNELGTLLLRARANNARLGISGLLIHHKGSFFQVLEGEKGPTELLYERIYRDKRHERVLVVSREVVQRRSFSDWSMGFVEGTSGDVSRLPGFNDFLRQGFKPGEGASRARGLALAFRDGRFRQIVDAG